MKTHDTKSVLLVGVGGQGTILASKILTAGLIAAGYDVKMSEVHGMSQRGGSVSTQVRYGTKVYSPIIGRGQADILVAFETMEAIRYLPDLKPGGKVVVNDYQMPSLPILSGEREYPDSILEELRSKADSAVDGYTESKTIDEAISEAEWSVDILRCAVRRHTRRRRNRKARGEE